MARSIARLSKRSVLFTLALGTALAYGCSGDSETDGSSGAGQGGSAGSAGSVSDGGSNSTGGKGGTNGDGGEGGVGEGDAGSTGDGSGGEGGEPEDALAFEYVVDTLSLPVNASLSNEFGMDLDDDGTADNRFGQFLSTLAATGYELQSSTDAAVDSGAILMLLDLRASALDESAEASVSLLEGENAEPAPCENESDLVCRRHLAGTGTFDVADSATPPDPIAGAIQSEDFEGDSGSFVLQLRLIGDEPVALRVVGARAALSDLDADEIPSGILAGGLLESDIETELMPHLALLFQALVEQDCPTPNPPDCNCAASSEGEGMLIELDDDDDCALSEEEVTDSSLVAATLAPDLTIDGEPALSVGVGLSAVKAAF